MIRNIIKRLKLSNPKNRSDESQECQDECFIEQIYYLPVENLILQNLSVQDLLNCSLVFKAWTSQLTRFLLPQCWREVALECEDENGNLGKNSPYRVMKLHYGQVRTGESPMMGPGMHHKTNPEFFMEVFTKLSMRRFHPNHEIFDDCGMLITDLTLMLEPSREVGPSSLIRRSWTVYEIRVVLTRKCPNIVKLALQLKESETERFNWTHEYFVVPWKLPNLKFFDIEHLGCPFQKFDGNGNKYLTVTCSMPIVLLFRKIMQSCPNLNTLLVTVYTIGDNLNDLLIEGITSSPSFTSGTLKTLSLRNAVDPLRLSSLLCNNETSRLKSLALWNMKPGTYDWATLFTSPCTTLLEELSILTSGISIESNITLDLPVLPHLKKLMISILKFVDVNFRWLQSVRQLNSLTITVLDEIIGGFQVNNNDMVLDRDDVWPNVTKLKMILVITDNLEQTLFSRVSRCFPCLKKLTMAMFTRSQCTQFVDTMKDHPTLDTLTLSFSFLFMASATVTSILTGFTVAEAWNASFRKKWPLFDRQEQPSLPHIGDLKRITSLTLYGATLLLRHPCRLALAAMESIIQMNLTKLQLVSFTINYSYWDRFRDQKFTTEDLDCVFESQNGTRLDVQPRKNPKDKARAQGWWTFSHASSSPSPN